MNEKKFISNLEKYLLQNRYLFWAIAGFFIGILFFLLCVGYKPLNPLYYNFVFAGGNDSATSFFGWLFYEKTPWSESLFGSFDSTYPHELSIIFSDAIIPVAVVSKLLFKNIICNGTITQIIGIWSALCYGLQGLFSGLIVSKLLKNSIMRLGGIILYVVSPIMLQKLFYHNTLVAQWLILAGICLLLFREELKYLRWVLWNALIILGTSIHVYFFPILLLVLGGQCVYEFVENRKIFEPLLTIVTSVASSFLELWILGAFSCRLAEADPESSYEILYEHGSNLLTLFNPFPYEMSRLLPDLPQFSMENGGFGYLGLGNIVLLFLAIAFIIYFLLLDTSRKQTILSFKAKQNLYITFILFTVFCFMLAVGPKVTLGEKLLFEIPIPNFLNYFFATFRVIGRFIWIVDYLLVTGCLYIVGKAGARLKNRLLPIALLFVAFLQIFDLSSAINVRREKYIYGEEWDYKIKDVRWEQLAQSHEYVYAIMKGNYPFPNDKSNSMILYAYIYDLKLTAMYIAHPSVLMKEDSDRYFQEIIEGTPNPDALYWFENEELMEKASPYLHWMG